MSRDIDTNIDAATDELLAPSPGRPFDPAVLEGLAEPVRRYFAASIVPGTHLATVVTLQMHGHIRIGRWLPFRADEVLAPHRGFVWRARAAGVVSGHDAYIDDRGSMRWKLLGVASVVRAAGHDVTTSAAGRCGGEAIWLPTVLLPEFGVDWSAGSADDIVARFHLGPTPIELHLCLDERGLPTSVVFDRWGDPDRTGTFGWHPFGGTITDHRTFDGISVPSAGVWGWHRRHRSLGARPVLPVPNHRSPLSRCAPARSHDAADGPGGDPRHVRVEDLRAVLDDGETGRGWHRRRRPRTVSVAAARGTARAGRHRRRPRWGRRRGR